MTDMWVWLLSNLYFKFMSLITRLRVVDLSSRTRQGDVLDLIDCITIIS